MAAMFKIKRASIENLKDLQELYAHHLAVTPPQEGTALDRWEILFQKISANANYYLLVGSLDAKVLASVTLVIIDNLTHNLRPYALIENVVTHAEHRNNGYATRLMLKACEIAQSRNCYKLMLMTGSKQSSTFNFYQKCGFNMQDKTAFIKWL